MCWFFHKWGKWSVAGYLKLRGSERRVGLVQERTCSKCGKIQAETKYYHRQDY